MVAEINNATAVDAHTHADSSQGGSSLSPTDVTINSGTTPSTVLTLDMAQPASVGSRDSHNLLLRGTVHDGVNGHNLDWQTFVDSDNSGNPYSRLLFQTRTDASSFVTSASM